MRMGLSIGAASLMPTNTTTVVARNSITRKKEGWRSAAARVSVMLAFPFAGLLVDSLIA
jgi:hypothetical protein